MIDPATGQRAGPNCPRARAVVMAYAKMPTQTSRCTGTVIPTPEVTSETAHAGAASRSTAPACCPRSSRPCRRPASGAGRVFAQQPEPGEPIELGSRVRVSVAKAVTWVTVPDLIGLNVDGGELGAARRGLQGARDARRLRQADRPRLLAVPDTAQAGRQGRADHADRERRNELT